MPAEFIKIHADAIQEFNRIQAAQRLERLQALKDRRFYSIPGAQWEGPLGELFSNKPRFEINKIHLSVMKIINEYRNNRITVDFHNKNGKKANDKLADTLDGLYRATEQDSWADEAYDNAFEEAVGGGYGAWRLRAVYEDEGDEDDTRQKILIEPIQDADSTVFFDLGSKRMDKRDAKRCYVMHSMTPEDFEEEYPDEPEASVQKVVHQHYFDWTTERAIYIAEFYTVEETTITIYKYETINKKEEKYTSKDFENNPELATELEAKGTTLTSQKEVKRQKVHKYIMSGNRILKDDGLIPGDNIPIVMNYGKRWFVDNIERAMGHVRLAKDAQRLKNMETSKLAEISATSSIGKPILSPEQIAGHELMWSEDHLAKHGYLLCNPTVDKDGAVTSVGPNAYLKTPDVPQPLAALMATVEQDLKDLTGNTEEGEKAVANLSGKAIELIQISLAVQTYIYMSNFSRAIKRSGEIWLGMAKEIYVENDRELQLVDKRNVTSTVKSNQPVMGDDGQIEYENDISAAEINIVVDVGPSSSTKRSAAVRALSTMMNLNQDPEIAKILGLLTMMNMEGEGVEDAKGYFRSQLVKSGVLTPTPDEQKELEAIAQQPDPNREYLLAAAQQQIAAAAKARSEVIKNYANSEKLNAETMEILAEIDNREQESAFALLDVIRNRQTAQPQSQGEIGK